MSGSNPFRRSKIITSDGSLPSTPNDKNDAITSGIAPRASSVLSTSKAQSSSNSKIVRIATPPLPSPPLDSTSYFPAVSFAGLGTHRGSPPPEDNGSISSDESDTDPFDPQSSGDIVTEGHSSQQVTTIGRPLEERNRAVEDVLPATLRSPPYSTERTSFNRFTMTETNSTNGKSNNPLDVDAFTRLLLTGNAETPSNANISNYGTASYSDTAVNKITPTQSGRAPYDTNSSNVDEPIPSLGQTELNETPGITRASTLPVRTESTEVHRTSSTRRPKPPPPRSHHGKPIKPAELSNAINRDISNSSTPIGSPTDRHESISYMSAKTSTPTTPTESVTGEDASSLYRSSSRSKRPPTPPLARRHSQMKPNPAQTFPERSNRLSLQPRSLGSSLPGPMSPGMKTPPRPPSRRHEKAMAGVQADTASQTKSSPSQSESTSLDNAQPTDDYASQASSSPSSRQTSVSQNLGAPAMTMPPPPPPPRRLRASSKSSNSSAQAIAPTPPISTNKALTDDKDDTSIPKSSQAQDILADLSRLQREVDTLRVHYAGRKVSQ